MAKFTFKGKKDKFNPNCTSTLLFDNKDGSTERIFCEETTCVDSHYVPTGTITPCRIQLLPSEHTDEKFIWGIEGGPWSTSIPYTGFAGSPNEFVGAGARFDKVKAIADPSGCGWKFINGRWSINPGFFSNVWDIQDTSNAGYSAMGGGDLNGIEVDPASVFENTLYEPGQTYDFDFGNPLGCGVQKSVWEIPKITYYNVGSDLVPEPHFVEFSDALISLTPPYNVQGYHEFPDFTETQEYYQSYIKSALAGPGKCGMIYDPVHHPGPDIPGLTAAFTYNGTTGPTLNASIYFPTRDNDALPGNSVKKGALVGTNITTGYRMQKYVQKKHRAYFTQNSSSIQVGLRHIETRMHALGYKAVWSFFSVTPKIVYATICPQCSPNYTYTSYSFQAKASVVIKVSYIPYSNNSYEYGPFRKDVPTGIQPGQLSPYNPPVAYSETNQYKGDILNPPWAGWVWERGLNPFNYDPRNNPQPSIILGSHYLMTYNVIGAKPVWGYIGTHSGSALTNDISNPDDPRRLKNLLYYTKELTSRSTSPYSMIMSQYQRAVVDPSYISYGGQSFSRLGNTYLPPAVGGYARQTASIPSSPNNFKMFRRKISPTTSTGSAKPIKLSYSSKREWFNGTCPFNLDFNYNKSDHIFIENNCSTTLIPHIEPSGE